MPRQVDHESRRRHIAQAVFELVGEHGIEAATLRDIAARAGVSMGAVQRCFAGKDEMLAFVVEHVNQRVTDRIRARIAASGDADAALTMLEETLLGTVPVDEQGLLEARVWLAFAAHAAVTPKLAALQREQYAGLAELIAVLLRAARAAGDVRADVDPDEEADALVVLTDGLNLQVLVGRHTPQSARAAVGRRLASIAADRGR